MKWKPKIKHRRSVIFPAPPPHLLELHEVLEAFGGCTREELQLLMQHNEALRPVKKWEKIGNVWHPRPLWRRASVYQAALLRSFTRSYPSSSPSQLHPAE